VTPSRLFYVLDSLEENDVGDQVATLLERLSRTRFEPRVVGLGGQGPLGARVRRLAVTVHAMELSGPVGSLLSVSRLRRVLRGLRADVVHTFQPWSGAAAQLAAPRETRVIRTITAFTRGRLTLEHRMQEWLERRAARRRDGCLLTVSDVLARTAVIRAFGVESVEVVPQCLDLTRVREESRALQEHDARVGLGLDDRQRAVLVYSDFADRSVPGQLLEGFAAARLESPELRLLFVGTGPEEGAARWRAEELRLEDSVVFFGAAPDRTALLRACRAAVDAGSFPGASRVCIEAMAVGIPVLRWVADEHLPPGAGREVSTGGPAARFARDLLHILEDEELRARVGAVRRAEAAEHDAVVVAERWSEIYARKASA
jgi:glycosyltransferase involved in cell wall biosynthesis